MLLEKKKLHTIYVIFDITYLNLSAINLHFYYLSFREYYNCIAYLANILANGFAQGIVLALALRTTYTNTNGVKILTEFFPSMQCTNNRKK